MSWSNRDWFRLAYWEKGLTDALFAKQTDFTLKTTDEVFEIRYQYAGVSLYYSPQPGKCYVLAARKWDPKLGYQLYVTFQPDGRDRALGTETSSEGSDFACEKRAYIHVSKVDGA